MVMPVGGDRLPKGPTLVGGLMLLLLSTGAAAATLAELTKDATVIVKNQAALVKDFCPVGAEKCDEDPGKVIDISTIGGILFVMCVGIAVGTDVTKESIMAVLTNSKRSFGVGMLCQFGFMPFFAFVMSIILKSDFTNNAYYSYEAAMLGVTIVGCLPGGNTSNLFTWFCGGNVSLSVIMSVISNVVAIGMLPLMLYLYYDLRFSDGEDVPPVPYVEIFVPLAAMIGCVAAGMGVRRYGSVETVWWTAKISSLISLIFLFLAVVIGIRKYPHIFTHGSYSLYIYCLVMQPAGYVAGWILATICRCSLRDKMTIAFETGVQSFTLGLVMANLGFNAEKEVCQFDARCMSLIEGTDTSKYEYSWSGDGRIKEGAAVGMITKHGFLPGQAGSHTTGGCCRFNELVYLDVFKFSAMCSVFYVVHAFWMIKFFRKIFPRGFARNTAKFEREEWEPKAKRERVVLADGVMPPAFAPSGAGSAEEMPAVSVIDLLRQAAARCGKEWAVGQELPVEPYVKGKSFSKPWDQWNRLTWQQYYDQVEMTARAFAEVGLQKNGSVAIYGFNSPYWNISALAAMMVGGKACGIYPTDTSEQVVYKVEHSNSSIAVVEDNKKLSAFKKITNESGAPAMACLTAIFMYGEKPQSASIDRGTTLPVYDWEAIRELSNKNTKKVDLSAPIDPGSPCVLVYTSGTTGMPKAVMLSHDNVCFGARAFLRLEPTRMGAEYSQERVLSYLPLSHIAGFQIDIICPIAITATTKGFATTYVARPYDLKEGSLKDRLTFVKPTIFLGVPRVWEKFYEGLKAVSDKVSKMKGITAQMPIICCVRKSTAARWSKSQGLRSAKALQYGASDKKHHHHHKKHHHKAELALATNTTNATAAAAPAAPAAAAVQAPATPAEAPPTEDSIVEKMKHLEGELATMELKSKGVSQLGQIKVNGPVPKNFAVIFAAAAAAAADCDSAEVKLLKAQPLDDGSVVQVSFEGPKDVVQAIQQQAGDPSSKLTSGAMNQFLVAQDAPEDADGGASFVQQTMLRGGQ